VTQLPQRMFLGQTPESRVAERRQQLVEAGLEILGTTGAAAMTVRAVCRHTGLSPKYFYESFATRDELLTAVYDQVINELTMATITAVLGAPSGVEQKLRAAFVAAATLFEEDPRRGRVLFRETLANAVLATHAEPQVGRYVATVSQLLIANSTELAVTEKSIAVAVRALAGATIVLYLDWLEGRLDLTRDQLADYCVRLAITIIQLGDLTPASPTAPARREGGG
jgi:AcrR family transcriptional regulator